MRQPSAMPWPSSAVNSGPRRLSQAHGITETHRNSQPTCSAAFCSSPADRPDVQTQAETAPSTGVNRGPPRIQPAALSFWPVEQIGTAPTRQAPDRILEPAQGPKFPTSEPKRALPMSGVNEIRSAFLDYFAGHDHAVVPSSPLVPRNDPTLMFTNAGMVQFKNVFTGVETRPYSRAATSQKCVRAGGKHNDLDNVGYTARHHTFFEMLGNFSFGDYFKERAIELAWNLVTKEFGLAKDRLTVTVYSEDDHAFDLWKKIGGLPEQRIIRIATSDNFW